MASSPNFTYPYDDSVDVNNELLSRCQKYDFLNFNSRLFLDKFSIVHLNIRSALHKMDELNIWLTSLLNRPNVVCLTETWFQPCMPCPVLPAYESVNVPRPACKGNGGGVCIYVAEGIKYSTLNVSVYNSFEYACVLIECHSKPLLVSVIYNPSSSQVTFLPEFATFLAEIDHFAPSADIFLAGDFNIDLLSASSTDFSNLLLESNIYPTIYYPTRLTISKQSLIDNIFTNCSSSWLSGVLNCNLSDHEMILLCADAVPTKSASSSNCLISVSPAKLEKAAAAYNWNFVTETSSVHEDCRQLTIGIMHCVTVSSVLLSSSPNNPYSPWITPAISYSCRLKHELYKKYLHGKIPYLEYSSYRNKLTSIIRARKTQYYSDLCSKNTSNAKEIWKCLNQLLHRDKPSQSNFELIDPNKLNEFFAILGPSSVANLPPPVFSHTKYVHPTLQSFSLFVVSETELSDTVNSLQNKSSSGFDGLSVKNLKVIYPHILKTLLSIVNKSFAAGVFPDALKIARVVPIHKGGDPSKLINFRPISVLSAVSKVFERVIFRRMISFINKYNLLSDSQFGFRSGHNTELAIIHALHRITSCLDVGNPTVGLFIDVSKAFDAIDHQILLDKLNLLGFRGSIHSLLKSYLSNRFQYIEINGVKSNLHKLIKGVPQGSILGPLLFLLYINDISNISDNLHFTLFADDTTVLYSNPSLKHSLQSASSAFCIVLDWFNSNKLGLNIDKTHFIFFSTVHSCPDILVVGNTVISRVQSVKFLGLLIDERLSWSVHINFLCTKLSKSLGILRFASRCLPRNVLMSMYFALFHSHLTYGLLIWGNTFATHLSPLRVLHKKCLRLLTHAQWLAHTPPLAIQLGLLLFDDLFTFHLSIFMFKVFHCLLPTRICQMFSRINVTYAHTRHSELDFFITRVRLDICKRFVDYCGSRLWSQLSSDVKSINTVALFKRTMFSILSCKYAEM